MPPISTDCVNHTVLGLCHGPLALVCPEAEVVMYRLQLKLFFLLRVILYLYGMHMYEDWVLILVWVHFVQFSYKAFHIHVVRTGRCYEYVNFRCGVNEAFQCLMIPKQDNLHACL